ncbi:hypothetical protein HMPREF0322_01911 [Desulfitobacterium hafniense DP7]|uniref:Uncharacterized protein n=1 Tax=Desulfitobacterium hafniense DP7 TaxID=537010 RepID=G9XLS6_DESHA|nr:hypothetical protein HMPREF0322_01911 [Desulfitobacterium hafniense DP7]
MKSLLIALSSLSSYYISHYTSHYISHCISRYSSSIFSLIPSRISIKRQPNSLIISISQTGIKKEIREKGA